MSDLQDRPPRPPVFRSLSAKLQLLTISLIAISVLSIAAVMMTEEIDEKLKEARIYSTASASTLAELAVFGAYTRNRDNLEQVARIAAIHPEYRYVEIFDAKGQALLRKVFFGDAPPEIPTSLDAMAAQRDPRPTVINAPGLIDILGGVDLHVLAPIYSLPLSSPDTDPTTEPDRREVLGFVHLGVGLGDLVRAMKQDLLVNLGGGLLLIVAGALLTVLLTRRIVGPVETLTAMAGRIAEGDLDAKVLINTGDELQVLGESFNRMSESLRQSKAQIAEYQENLESMVRRRTEELQKVALQAQQLAQRDVLTGLANRALLNSRLHLALAQAERRGDKVVVASIDLEGFGAFNEAHGREIGDDLLQAVGSRLSANVREGDTVARIDADVFVLVIGDIRAPSADQDIAAMINKIDTAMQRPHDLDGRKFRIAANIGVAIYPDDGSSARIVLANAREAMSRARESGSYRFHKGDMEERIARRRELEQGLRAALLEDKLVVTFDPVVNLALGTVVRADANLVWMHPEQGPIPCYRVMTMAEEAGLHEPIAALFLKRSCEAAARIQAATTRKTVVSMRLTTRQAQQADLISVIDNAVRASGADPELISIGIPESAVAADLGAAVILMRSLRSIGVRIIVDEYGTGATNLSDLARLPIDAVVIDRSFVRGLSGSASDRSVVQAYIAMAHSLGLRLAAESVDDASALAFLQEHGCDEAQGATFGVQTEEETITRLVNSPAMDLMNAMTLGSAVVRH